MKGILSTVLLATDDVLALAGGLFEILGSEEALSGGASGVIVFAELPDILGGEELLFGGALGVIVFAELFDVRGTLGNSTLFPAISPEDLSLLRSPKYRPNVKTSNASATSNDVANIVLPFIVQLWVLWRSMLYYARSLLIILWAN